MASTDTLDSSATAECPQSDRLKHYLSGWLSESDSEQLELHLQQCDTCESALRTMETQQDTLLQSLQATVAQSVSPAGASASAATTRTSEPLASNDARPKSAASSDANASLVLTAAAQVATSSNTPELDAAMSKVRRLFDAPAEQESQAFIRSWHPAQRDFGIYELIRPLGRGGMGAVYLAKHRQLGRHVAIKLLPMMSAEDDDVRTRFDREIRVVGRLSHPSIVAATDAGEIDGTQYLVMEYVAGMDLSRLSRLMGRLPVADACELIRQAALGLSCAHAEGVVHRDIKPSNMMLDELGHIRILDFGLAQWTVWDEASVDLTTVGQLMGTLDYMAPEQAEASSGVDYRADLYALGATLFRLLCGRAPLAAAPNQSPLEKLRLLANHQPPKLSTLCPEAPEELVKLVASLLSRSASDRPASAAHVAEQLAPFAEGSKLVELLQQAREKAAASPEPARKSANPDRAVFTESAPVSIAPQPETTGKGGSRILRRLLLAASLPLMILAGILIKLELSKGQLIIESDVDNVNVKLLKEGKPVDGIQVTHGTTSTRLHADTYEITIDGPSDGLIIDHDKFTLKNGETVIARIQQVPRMAKEAEPAETRMPDRTVFDGQPLGYWLTVIENERSIERLRSAFGACSVLLTDNTADLITEKVLAALPEISPAKLKLSATSDEIRQLDSLAFRLVSLANPGEKWITMMVRELNKHDDSWQERVVNHLWLNSEADRLSDNNLLPLVEWARIQLVAETATGPVGRERAAEVLLRIIQREEESGDLSSKCVQILDAEKTLPLSWWLVKPLNELKSQNSVTWHESWPNKLTTIVITRALNALNDGKLQGQELGHALVILKQARTLSPEQKVVLLNSVKRQLVERSASVDRLTEFVTVSPSFTLLCVPEVGLSFHISLPRPPGLCLISFELLNLLQQLDPQSGDVAPIQAVRNALPKVEPIVEGRTPSFFSSIRGERQPTFSWPELKMSNGKVADRTQLATFLISEHPLLKTQATTDTPKEPAVVKSDGDPPAGNTKRPAASPIEPRADEVPFKTQIQTLLQSKNEAELIKLFEKRLKLPAAPPEPELAQTLIEQLPTFPVSMMDGGSKHNYVLDFHAFNFIAKSCPEKFFAMWRQSFEAAESESWRLRLIERLQNGMWGNIAETEGRKQDVSAFEAWFMDYIKAAPTPNSEKEKLVPLIASRVLDRFGSFAQNPTLVAAVEASPYIKPDWWLVPVSKDPSQSLADKKRFSAALDVLRDDDCSTADLAKACIIIALIMGEEKKDVFFKNEGDPITLNEDLALKKLIDSLLQVQLHRLVVSPDEDLWKTVNLSERFRSPLSVSELQLSSSIKGIYQSLPVAELLDLIFVLRVDFTEDSGLEAFFAKCKAGRARVKLNGRDLRRWLATTEILWDTSFRAISIIWTDAPDTRTPQVCSDQLWGAGSTPSKADWIQFCLSYHKALAPYRKEFEAAQARTKTAPPMPSPAEPLYNGQPLEHWLEMLSRERSVEGLKAAFEACAALLTPQNAETVTETLYRVLPGLDGNLKVTDKEQNRVWTLDYEAATILRKANPGSTFFVRWVTARTASTNAEWNKRLLTYISYSGPESFDDLKPVVSWAGSVLSQDVSSNADAVAIADAAVLLRGFLNYESVKDYVELAKTSTDILINCSQLNEDWWISQPIQYRSSNGNTEFGTPAFRDKVVSVAIRVLDGEDSSPSQVAQACMILANGATLSDEQQRSVLTVIQRRLEQLAKDKEALVATTTVPESFSDFAAPIIASNSPLPVSPIMVTTPSSMARSIPVTTTSLVVQMLNVVFTTDDGKTTEPQRQLLFEATRGVFDIVMSARPKAQDEQESAVSRGFRIPPNAIPGLLWPDLELTDGAGPFGPRYPQLAQRVTKELWRDHAPTKSDWMHFIILTHPAMKDVVNRAIEDRKNVAPPVEVPKP